MMTEKELLKRDAKRDIGAELLQSVKQMKAGKVGAINKVDIPEVIEARNKIGLTQAQFADLMGVSRRTLQEWEQGRKKPSGAANSLLKIAINRPEVLQELFVHPA